MWLSWQFFLFPYPPPSCHKQEFPFRVQVCTDLQLRHGILTSPPLDLVELHGAVLSNHLKIRSNGGMRRELKPQRLIAVSADVSGQQESVQIDAVRLFQLRPKYRTG